MSGKKGGGLKSAWELALENLDRREGPAAALTGEQKRAIAEIDSRTRAKLAETEILYESKLAKARAEGETDKLDELLARRKREIDRVRDAGEREKAEVRRR